MSSLIEKLFLLSCLNQHQRDPLAENGLCFFLYRHLAGPRPSKRRNPGQPPVGWLPNVSGKHCSQTRR